MTKPIQKSLQDYLTKIKRPATRNINLSSKQLSSSTSWILRGCKHPRTPSIDLDQKQTNGEDAATLDDVDRFLFENFKSLYLRDHEGQEDDDKEGGNEEDGEEKSLDGLMFDHSPKSINPPPDLCGSHRFFMNAGSSRSLLEEARSSTTVSDAGSSSTTTTEDIAVNNATRTSDEAKDAMGPGDFITVLTYSSTPYDEFRRSMQEMIEARLNHNGKIGWEFMEELLFCYLNLNDKKSYKYILSAYVDLIVVLRENSGRLPVKSRRVRPVGKRGKEGGL